MTLRPRLAAAVTAALLLGACGPSATDEAGVQVAAGFYPLAWIAGEVGGEEVSVVNLTRAGQDPHDTELSIKQTAQVAEADLVLLTADLQAAVAEAAEQNASGIVLDTAEVIDLRPAEDHSGDHSHDHSDEHDHAHADDQADDRADDRAEDHDHGDLDPHFWLDPLRMARIADAVADRLAEADPDHAEDYRTNAAEVRRELERLDADLAAGLQDCERDTVVVSHDAFGYLSRYGLHFEPIAGLSPGAEPSPAHLQRLQQLVRDEGLTTVFTERLSSAAMAESLAGDLGLRTDVLDPLEGLTDETGSADYLSLMRDNLAALQEANGC